MLVQIGQSPASHQNLDAIGMLTECHGRIRRFSELAERLAEAHSAAPAEIAARAGDVHRYFTVAYPLHVEDEERALLPRLAGRGEVEVERALKRMQAEHHVLEVGTGALVRAMATLMETPERFEELSTTLARNARSLREGFESHLVAEETVLFPAGRRLLSSEERNAFLEEIRARRRPK